MGTPHLEFAILCDMDNRHCPIQFVAASYISALVCTFMCAQMDLANSTVALRPCRMSSCVMPAILWFIHTQTAC